MSIPDMKKHQTHSSLLALLFFVLLPTYLLAQESKDRFPILSDLGSLSGSSAPAADIQVKAEYRLTEDSSAGELKVTAALGDDWHIYSVTQKPGGPMRSSIDVKGKGLLEFTGTFKPDTKPTVKNIKYFDVPVEEHKGTVTWSAPFRLLPGVNPESLVLTGTLKGQICDEAGRCVPLSTLDTDFEATNVGTLASLPETSAPPTSGSRSVDSSAASLAGYEEPTAEGYRPGRARAAIRGQITSPVGPGQVMQLVVTIEPDETWHVYAYEPKEVGKIAKPTLIALTGPSGWQVGQAKASSDPIVKATGIEIEPEQRYHEGAVSWTIPIAVPPSTAAGSHIVTGMVGFQTCTEVSCDKPLAVKFGAVVEVGTGDAEQTPLKFTTATYPAVAKFLETGQLEQESSTPTQSAGSGSFDLSQIIVQDRTPESLATILMLAFVGGFVLNFMPCVLPVIGLKIMAFVQQAGEDRLRIFLLNLAFSIGLLSIFWVLATLASAASLGLSSENLGWGEQFNYDGFTIPLLSVVFVMGLSFLGVWEIPIPGFVGSGKSGELAAKEGMSGAFFKGVVTTILATPCSGPGLATALTWSASQPPPSVYMVFTTMGLGMAFPYLLIGAFPSLIRFIPKPGPWMDTFKQLMGFLLLGTVVYMFTLIDQENVIPTLALIFALWASCWWIGRTPISADLLTKLRAWAFAGIFASIVGWFAFVYEANKDHQLPWQDYSLATLSEHVEANRTVLIDFTADW